jgi:hypothetical protein
MGTHSADNPSKVREAYYWAVAHRRKIASAVIVALPLVSRFAPDFPTAEVKSFLELYFGA